MFDVLQASFTDKGRGKGCIFLGLSSGLGTTALRATGHDKQGSARADRKHLEKSAVVNKVCVLPARNVSYVIRGKQS